MGPDFMSASFMYGIDTTKIRYWLQTHSHSDHFSAAHLVTRMPVYAAENVPHLSLYASSKCIKNMSEKLSMEEFGANLFEKEWLNKLALSVNSVKYCENIKIDSYNVAAFDANHDDFDGASIYLVSDDKCKLFYGLDTNGITEETLNYLEEKNICLDLIVLDHTYGYDINANDHLNGNKFIKTINEMKSRNIIKKDTKIYASHISHEGNLPYNEFVLSARKNGYHVAFDGLEIKI